MRNLEDRRSRHVSLAKGTLKREVWDTRDAKEPRIRENKEFGRSNEAVGRHPDEKCGLITNTRIHWSVARRQLSTESTIGWLKGK